MESPLSVDRTADQLFDETTPRKRPLWPWFAFGAGGLVILALLLRKKRDKVVNDPMLDPVFDQEMVYEPEETYPPEEPVDLPPPRRGPTGPFDDLFKSIDAEASPDPKAVTVLDETAGQSFEALIGKPKRTCVLMLHSQSCGHCHDALPKFQQAARYAKIPFYTAEVETNLALSSRLGVEYVPYITRVDGGVPSQTFEDDIEVASLSQFGS